MRVAEAGIFEPREIVGKLLRVRDQSGHDHIRNDSSRRDVFSRIGLLIGGQIARQPAGERVEPEAGRTAPGARLPSSSRLRLERSSQHGNPGHGLKVLHGKDFRLGSPGKFVE